MFRVETRHDCKMVKCVGLSVRTFFLCQGIHVNLSNKVLWLFIQLWLCWVFQATRQKCACPWDKLCQRFVGITFLQVCLGQSDRGFHALCVVLTKMRFMTMRFMTMYFIILTWWKEFFSVQSTFDRSTAHQKLLYSVLSSLAEKWVISWK